MSTKKRYRVGDIENAKVLGYKDQHKMILASCEICGRRRWQRLIKNKPQYEICFYCSQRERVRNGKYK